MSNWQDHHLLCIAQCDECVAMLLGLAPFLAPLRDIWAPYQSDKGEREREE